MFDFWSIIRRFLYMIFVLWVVATIIFFMFRLMPGSPLTAFIGTTFTDEQHDLLVKRLGLDNPNETINLAKKAAAKGGKLTMEDMMKLHGV